jgi:predicted nuclease with RNAse H fold
MLMGIDFGSKLAGTTVICYGLLTGGPVSFVSSAKKQDADTFIRNKITELKPNLIAIDAPLSLPIVYSQPNQGADYFYRGVDRALKAMSPMFLGGLTARAMRLKSDCEASGIKIVETYPAAFVEHFLLSPFYKKKESEALKSFVEELCNQFQVQLNPSLIINWHHADAFMAWLSCRRLVTQQSIKFGNEEGAIFI